MKYNERMKKQGNYELSFEPKSIWDYKRNNILENICNTDYKKSTDKSNGNWMKAGNGTFFSGWNKEYHKRIVEMYTSEEDIILDPFAGHSSSFIPFLMKRNFIGFEITKERFQEQQNHIKILQSKFIRSSTINLINDSSEFIPKYVNSNSVDCIITDPPFWNLEKYEEPVNGTQLSDLSNKQEFDTMFQDIIKKAINTLKIGKFIIVKIANFRRKGKYLNLKDEWIHYIEQMGVELVDEIIIELSPVKRHPLYNQAITNMNCLKVHEFLIVFRKMDSKENNDNINNDINFNRPLVSDIYETEDRLFWSETRGKIDWITESIKNELQSNENANKITGDTDVLF